MKSMIYFTSFILNVHHDQGKAFIQSNFLLTNIQGRNSDRFDKVVNSGLIDMRKEISMDEANLLIKELECECISSDNNLDTWIFRNSLNHSEMYQNITFDEIRMKKEGEVPQFSEALLKFGAIAKNSNIYLEGRES